MFMTLMCSHGRCIVHFVSLKGMPFVVTVTVKVRSSVSVTAGSKIKVQEAPEGNHDMEVEAWLVISIIILETVVIG